MRRHRNSKPAFRDQKLEPGHLPKSFYRSQGCEKRAYVFDRSQGDGHHTSSSYGTHHEHRFLESLHNRPFGQ